MFVTLTLFSVISKDFPLWLGWWESDRLVRLGGRVAWLVGCGCSVVIQKEGEGAAPCGAAPHQIGADRTRADRTGSGPVFRWAPGCQS